MMKILKSLILIIFFYFLLNSNSYSQWVLSNSIDGICFTADKSNNIYFGTWFSGVYRSGDNGLTWIHTAFFPGTTARSLASNGNVVFAGTSYAGVYMSSNQGSNWISVNQYQNIVALFTSVNTIFAGGNGMGVLASTDNGSTWTTRNTGLTNLNVETYAGSGNNIFTGTFGGGIFFSTNAGLLWSKVNTGLSNLQVMAIALSGNNVFAGTFGGGVFCSTNNGSSWVEANNGLTHKSVLSLITYGDNVYAGIDTGGVFVSVNNGLNWVARNEGISPGSYFRRLFISNGYLFASIGTGIYRRPLSEIIGVHPVSNEIPKTFSLSQNYPNPFNPSTNINYGLPISGLVKLTIFDVLGREVEILINENQNSGSYSINWDASNYPSGVYYYRVEADNFIETKKMVLIK